jgi:ribosomal protein L37E
MSDAELHIRCQRCGAAMEMRDPGPGMPWTPDQFWVCNNCGRHFWTTYPPPKPAAAATTAAAAKPAAEPAK